MGYLSCNAESAIATCDPYYWECKRRKNKTNRNKPNKPIKIRDFTYPELVKATNGFSAESFLGKGSHGTVYKASLDDGRLIAAVKAASRNPSISIHSNCTSCTTPAENEIEILSRVQHPRLVNLIGFCVDCKDRKLLVVEYMPNGSLYSLLHCSSRPPGWTRRVRFALQIAKAVQALHSANPPVIHRDIKSPNVLIDENWNARLGDFGLALRGHVEDVRAKCTPPAGTLGYLDPGYLAPGDLSTKSDVFSFGILLLEVISGRNAIDVNYSPPSIVDWAVPLIKRGDFSAICDHRIGSPVDPGVIRNLAILAAKCVRSTAEKRPAMTEVVEALKMVRKRIQAPHIWNSLRRRVGLVEESRSNEEAIDSNKEIVNANKTTRVGNRRNRKVSNVEYGNETIGFAGERVSRSKSVGSFSDTKLRRSDSRRKAGVAVKIPVVKLSKSRSMGVLQRSLDIEMEGVINSREIEASMSKLLIELDEKSEQEMQEKPLVISI
ncbi:serine/threonine-protein kinase-like protein At1g28390 [Manihot esculenta]|uniref:BHLH domain-containing protein n=1 Tax=Manihot esculenta TaxID=3983 RepID=A0A2C9U134_MANES|nr:serine/threonine-protein kinase-like protein At1g28390 [Manihot esculenta]OAY23246.2 hypothetical protein MANES_18G061500v8 [Manihot esculenta]